MNLTEPVNALLFDLGGVMIDIDFGRVFAHWAKYAPYSPAQINQRFVLDDTYHRYERGETDDAAFFDHVRRTLDLDASDAQIRDGWNAVFVAQNEPVLGMVKQASKTLPSYAFTNTSSSHQTAWTVAYPDVVSAFRRIFSSTEMGLRKPDRAAFEAVVQAIGQRPESILFFDDLASNVAGARAAGLQAVQVSGPRDVREGLRALDLL
jgi:putative hydrolase of the HAD superfamily